jgi:hypothetical protein
MNRLLAYFSGDLPAVHTAVDTSQYVSPPVPQYVTTVSPLAIVPGVVALVTALLYILL